MIYLNKHNSFEHELMKTRVALEQMKLNRDIITEAVRKSDGKIIDVVCLDDGEEYEIVFKNDNPKVIERYRREGVNIVYANV